VTDAGRILPHGLRRRHPGQTPGGQKIGQQHSAKGTQCRQHKGNPTEEIEGRVLLHAHHHPGRDGKVQPKPNQEAGNQAQRRHRNPLFQQIAPQLAGRQAQGFQPGQPGPILPGGHLHNGKDHQKAAQKDQKRRGVVGLGLLAGSLHPGIVIGQVGGKGQFW